jgi:hypothetical protein
MAIKFHFLITPKLHLARASALITAEPMEYQPYSASKCQIEGLQFYEQREEARLNLAASFDFSERLDRVAGELQMRRSLLRETGPPSCPYCDLPMTFRPPQIAPPMFVCPQCGLVGESADHSEGIRASCAGPLPLIVSLKSGGIFGGSSGPPHGLQSGQGKPAAPLWPPMAHTTAGTMPLRLH